MAVRWRTRTAGLLMVAGALLGLTGCGSSSPLPVFDHEQTANDIFLSTSDDHELEIESGSSRFLGTDSRGIDYYTYLTRDEAGEGVCLVVVADGAEDWTSGCGSLPVTVGVPEAGVDSATLGNFRDVEQSGEMVGDYVAVEGPEY
ncbi:hypothetical protein [Paramicrobacterium chengjingii]|uniref:Lipoprotein n=1 Tax=Paramicrobacterium chengjingii TaxID=2769067 RepID=A0ABX6YKM0_9MICO|nr:hypothetical protein [Microbacterium chengjingii]QPZ39205.1 hypothetical protein HCR76_03825 [Microbacterium chengjingii]